VTSLSRGLIRRMLKQDVAGEKRKAKRAPDS
jgi:hypothetical protein